MPNETICTAHQTLKNLRKILSVPEGGSITEHATAIMEELGAWREKRKALIDTEYIPEVPKVIAALQNEINDLKNINIAILATHQAT